MEKDTVTIPREEYERLKRIEALFKGQEPIDDKYIKRLREELDDEHIRR